MRLLPCTCWLRGAVIVPQPFKSSSMLFKSPDVFPWSDTKGYQMSVRTGHIRIYLSRAAFCHCLWTYRIIRRLEMSAVAAPWRYRIILDFICRLLPPYGVLERYYHGLPVTACDAAHLSESLAAYRSDPKKQGRFLRSSNDLTRLNQRRALSEASFRSAAQ